MPTLDDYWNTEEWHNPNYDMQLKYVLNDWGYAEKQLNKQWLIKLANEQFKVLLLRRLIQRSLQQGFYLTLIKSLIEIDSYDSDKRVSG